ncbi:hypothetical protein [Paraflavitalea speifideaquila]|uniref:hypothetical protein n=1 Tax=Paraflavitalea speifideaquila TaxID=3076558 RepID=UPI0028EED359|nr:hypothetical protein [Paraflavitalea speifideiaquila]
MGTTPCGQHIRPIHHIAANTDCALVEWELTLLRDPNTKKPTTFRISGNSSYILPDNNYSKPGTKNEASGKWSIREGTGSLAGSVIYQLDAGSPNKILRFVKLSDDLLHLLDQQGHAMRGDPFQSYTLNRIAQ